MKKVWIAFTRCWFLLIDAYAKSREGVVDDAEKYITECRQWQVTQRNIRDEKKWDETEQKLVDGSNGYDDRGETYDEIEIDGMLKKIWKYDTNLWPYQKDHYYDCEAYAYGEEDIHTVFKEKVAGSGAYTNQKWIAGKRSSDPGEVSGYNGYAGLDCSGFISNTQL